MHTLGSGPLRPQVSGVDGKPAPDSTLNTQKRVHAEPILSYRRLCAVVCEQACDAAYRNHCSSPPPTRCSSGGSPVLPAFQTVPTTWISIPTTISCFMAARSRLGRSSPPRWTEWAAMAAIQHSRLGAGQRMDQTNWLIMATVHPHLNSGVG